MSFLVAVSLLPLQQAQMLQKFPFSHTFVPKPQPVSWSCAPYGAWTISQSTILEKAQERDPRDTSVFTSIVEYMEHLKILGNM